jgi:branched-chain amino acid transport system substrate-binding protein
MRSLIELNQICGVFALPPTPSTPVGGYDGMHLIYQALEKTNGETDADAVIAAMKGMKWESPRGPISIDPRTRDIVQNIYIRKVEKVNGEPWAMEFATFEAVKDPLKEAAAR